MSHLVTRAVGFTGSRPKGLYGYGPGADAAYDALEEGIARLLADAAAWYGPLRVITGGAQGADQLAFAAAERARAQGVAVAANVVVIPFEGQDAAWQEGGRFGRASYAAMLATADAVVDASAVARGRGDRRSPYLVRNDVIVGMSDLVVAVVGEDFDERGRSGTAATIRRARALGRPVRYVMAPRMA